MRLSHHLSITLLTATVAVLGEPWVPHCFGQEMSNSTQSNPAVAGKPGHLAAWANSTTLGNSIMVQAAGGNMGIGTAAPSALLEVNGATKVDGDFTVTGNILSSTGSPMIQNNDGFLNFSAGIGALGSTASGGFNTAFGDNALAADSSGFGNTATGYTALAANTSGYDNTAVGNQALSASTTGVENTAVGAQALLTNTIGMDSTAVGYQASVLNTSGASNTAVGSGALAGNSTGSNNIALGAYSGTAVTGSNNIEIGNEGLGTDNGVIRIGTGAQNATFISGIAYQTTGLSGALPVVIDTNGQLGTFSSSRRYKEDIHDMGDASSGLMLLHPVTFRYKKPFADGSKPTQFGLIAEEVANVYPDLVVRKADGQVEGVEYQVLDSMLLNELQKQHATIAAQQEQIRTLEERLAHMETRLGATVTASAH